MKRFMNNRIPGTARNEGNRRGFTLAGLMLVIILIGPAAFMAVPALAGPRAGVWPVQLVADGTVMSADTSGVSIFKIDFTAKTRYTGNVLGQFTGVTISGVSDPASAATGWPVASEAGVSVYYANSTLNMETDSGSSVFDLMNWTLLTGTGDTLLSGNTYQAFDIGFDPAAPYGYLKFVKSAASPFAFGFRYSTSGNP